MVETKRIRKAESEEREREDEKMKFNKNKQEMNQEWKKEKQNRSEEISSYSHSSFSGFFLAVTPQSVAQGALENRTQNRSKSEKEEGTDFMAWNHNIQQS